MYERSRKACHYSKRKYFLSISCLRVLSILSTSLQSFYRGSCKLTVCLDLYGPMPDCIYVTATKSSREGIIVQLRWLKSRCDRWRRLSKDLLSMWLRLLKVRHNRPRFMLIKRPSCSILVWTPTYEIARLLPILAPKLSGFSLKIFNWLVEGWLGGIVLSRLLRVNGISQVGSNIRMMMYSMHILFSVQSRRITAVLNRF